MTGGPPGAVLLLSAWVDDGALRVRLTASDDLAGPTRPVGVAGDVDGACELVRCWLQGVAESAGAAPDVP
ncbi:hypothetical protein PHK61_00485 [Actinomycetospora lutea]|uniref:hypothetical protein n=1 Tax=Actinomycetospora lutea TaxID=663604 RepID=UPI002365056D|nr:hypothetical protein [Actinomycetospora lutea]MDD7936892.1 hypothetical protein [Actinomycetospora lutea]